MPHDSTERHLVPKMLGYLLQRLRRGGAFTLPEGIASTSRLLFVDTGDMTDLLFAAPVVNWFHYRFPKMHTTLLVMAEHAGVAKSIMKVSTILTYERRQMRLFQADYIALIRRLRRQSIETVVLLSRGISIERHFLAFASGAPTRIGFHHQLAFPFANCEIRVSSNGYEGLRMTRIVESLGLRTGTIDRSIELPVSDVNHARQLIHFRKPEKDVLLVGVDPGPSKSRHKVIPETIAFLANNLAGGRRVKFLVLSAPWDERAVAKLRREIKAEVVDLVPSSLQETLALLSQCGLFIAGNTDLLHFAAALGVPTVGLFTRYDGPTWTPPEPTSVRVFRGTRGEKLSLKAFFTKVDEALATREHVTV
jgi:heptosyltransferase-2